MRPYNFGAGPATLPEEVLAQASEEMLDWQNLGMSVMEISHRSPPFITLMEETVELFRILMAVPPSHQIILMGVPARYHYMAIPMNFLHHQADYVVSGIWSKLALEEAQRLGQVSVAADNSQSQYLEAPKNYQFNVNADYCFMCTNETLVGLRLHPLPSRPPATVPVIADMTSCILSEAFAVGDFGMIFAGAQKNFGPAGLSVVIVDQSLLDTCKAGLPHFIDYNQHVLQQSMYATPPTFSIYVANLTLKWLQAQGGIGAIAKHNRQKASRLYNYIDQSDYYVCPTAKEVRSLMNVPFRLAEPEREAAFLEQARQHQLLALKGHRLVGGMRASLYNAMPMAGIDALITFMADFARQ